MSQELTVADSALSKRRAYKNGWQREQRRKFREANGFSTSANYSNAGIRKEILERDSYACVRCGMTDEQHKIKFGRPITVDHISKDRSDNRPENLQTLCLSCHGKKDLIPRLRAPRFDRQEIKRLRALGWTFEHIGRRLGCSITIAWKYGKAVAS